MNCHSGVEKFRFYRHLKGNKVKKVSKNNYDLNKQT